MPHLDFEVRRIVERLRDFRADDFSEAAAQPKWIAWQHEFGNCELAIEARFANGAGDQFTVDGPRTGRDSLLVGAGASAQFSELISAYLYCDGQLGRTNYDLHSFGGGVPLAF